MGFWLRMLLGDICRGMYEQLYAVAKELRRYSNSFGPIFVVLNLIQYSQLHSPHYAPSQDM